MQDDFDLEDAFPIWMPEEIVLNSEKECEEILHSEDFEIYVRQLADRNPYAVRVGIALKSGQFIMDLLRCTQAARNTFDAQMESEGQTYEAYRNEHYCECMILREYRFREVIMPEEITAVPLNKIKELIGDLTEKQEKRYNEKTQELSKEEVREYIDRYRQFVNLLGWRNIMKQDKNYEN